MIFVLACDINNIKITSAKEKVHMGLVPDQYPYGNKFVVTITDPTKFHCYIKICQF